MTLDNRQRQELKARAHHLKGRIIIGKAGATDAVLADIRRAFSKSDLLKVRIQHPERAEIDRIVKHISATVPCELVGRVGFVAIFHKSPEEAAE